MKQYSTLDNPIIVPVQQFAYELACTVAIQPDDAVLDVGFGLGYGMATMRLICRCVVGVEIDNRAIVRAHREYPSFASCYLPYDGCHLPFADGSFDVVTCVDVLEHVEDYDGLLSEMARVTRRCVLISTPNRLPQNTNADGTPRNYWHLREWNYSELASVLSSFAVDWHFIDGRDCGPYRDGDLAGDTQALAPVIRRKS